MWGRGVLEVSPLPCPSTIHVAFSSHSAQPGTAAPDILWSEDQGDSLQATGETGVGAHNVNLIREGCQG